MTTLTPDQVASAFRASMPRVRSEFERKRRLFHEKITNTSYYPDKYLDALMEFLDDEVHLRIEMGEKHVRDLLDSGWKPEGANAISVVVGQMFQVSNHRENPYSDLYDAADMGNRYIGLPNPSGPAAPRQRLAQSQVDATKAAVARLEAYLVKGKSTTGPVFYGPGQYVAGDGNTVNMTNVGGNLDARSILNSTSTVRQHIDDFAADDREDVEAHIGTVEEELGKAEPNQGRMRAAWRAIQKLASAISNAALNAAIDSGMKSMMGG